MRYTRSVGRTSRFFLQVFAEEHETLQCVEKWLKSSGNALRLQVSGGGQGILGSTDPGSNLDRSDVVKMIDSLGAFLNSKLRRQAAQKVEICDSRERSKFVITLGLGGIRVAAKNDARLLIARAMPWAIDFSPNYSTIVDNSLGVGEPTIEVGVAIDLFGQTPEEAETVGLAIAAALDPSVFTIEFGENIAIYRDAGGQTSFDNGYFRAILLDMASSACQVDEPSSQAVASFLRAVAADGPAAAISVLRVLDARFQQAWATVRKQALSTSKKMAESDQAAASRLKSATQAEALFRQCFMNLKLDPGSYSS